MSQRIIDRSYVGDVLQHMYTSRLNVRLIVSLEEGYFYAELLDKKVPLRGTAIEEAVTDLALQLAHEFPKSSFAEWWNYNFQQEQSSQNL